MLIRTFTGRISLYQLKSGQQEVSRCRTRGESYGIKTKHTSEGYILALKPKEDVTESPNQGLKWTHKKDWCPPILFFKRFNFSIKNYIDPPANDKLTRFFCNVFMTLVQYVTKTLCHFDDVTGKNQSGCSTCSTVAMETDSLPQKPLSCEAVNSLAVT